MNSDKQNWAGNYTFKASQIHSPTSIEALRGLVADSPQIRAIGTRHSFNAIADSPGVLVDLASMPADITIDRARKQVSVGAAIRYSDLAFHLHQQGFALHNLASLPHISVAGAIATGTHGSGDRNQALSGAVAALDLICHDGTLVTIARGHEDFEAMVVGLGAFGIVHRLVLDLEPTFDVRQDAFISLAWDELLAKFDAISSCAYSVSVFTKWSGPAVNRIWLKTRVDTGSTADLPIAHLGLQPGSAFALAATPVEADDPAGRHNPFGGIPGPWSERLAHFRPEANPGAVEQIQSEYLIPRRALAAAVGAIRGMSERVDAVLRTTEIRTMAADTFWLSPAYEQETVALHFTWEKRQEAVDAITRELEAALLPLGARPHWGKVIHATAADLAPFYPRLAEFCARADHYDPVRKFRNPFLQRHVFGR